MRGVSTHEAWEGLSHKIYATRICYCTEEMECTKRILDWYHMVVQFIDAMLALRTLATLRHRPTFASI